MTETRIRWEPTGSGSFAGHVGTLESWMFYIHRPVLAGQRWMLSATLPGALDDVRPGSPDELKAEAERWLEEFVSSLGAVFPAEREEFEFPRDRIDLDDAFGPGAYVRYQHPDAGWEDDQEAGRKFLTHGRLYRVAWNDIGQSKTRIGLVGVQGSFNSVLFEPVASEDVTDAEAAEVARRSAPATPAPLAGEKESKP